MLATSGAPWRFLAILAGLTAVGAAVVYGLLPWRPRLEFDVVGVIWVLINAPKLAAGFLALLFTTAGVLFALRSLRES